MVIYLFITLVYFICLSNVILGIFLCIFAGFVEVLKKISVIYNGTIFDFLG
jgi:hypothetical protein